MTSGQGLQPGLVDGRRRPFPLHRPVPVRQQLQRDGLAFVDRIESAQQGQHLRRLEAELIGL